MAEGLQRAFNAASDSRRTARKPAKPWRVYGTGQRATDYRSQSAAYEAVNGLTAAGAACAVWHWEDGSWKLYERIEAAGTAGTEGER